MSSIFVCKNCDYRNEKWQGQCPNCGSWNTMESQVVSSTSKELAKGTAEDTLPIAQLSSINLQESTRVSTGSSEFDRVLGGGLLLQSVILISGEPGIGKSTLLLKLAAELTKQHGDDFSEKILYICAEESPQQIKLRASRMNISQASVHLSAEYRIEHIRKYVETIRPKLLIIDSIQALRSDELAGHAGTIQQLRACLNSCYEWSHRYMCCVVIVAHITKDGAIAGPKLIEHMVDTVLVFEQSKNNLRFLYSRKNRYGAVDEVGVFTMRETGLEDLRNANIHFLEERGSSWPSGICIASTYEGSRSFLVELQALTVPVLSNNRVFSEIINPNQVFKIAAVLERHASITLSSQNMYINTAGGIRIQEPGIELAVALALYSAHQNKPLPVNYCAMGEVSLAGEIRAVSHFEQRCKQAEEIGIQTIVLPEQNLKETKFKASHATLIPVSTIQDAITVIHRKEHRA